MKKILSVLLVTLLLAGLLAGCGKSSSDASAVMTDGETMSTTTAAASEAADQASGSSGVSSGDKAASASSTASQRAAVENAKLIYTAELDLETTEFDSAVQQLQALTTEIGGYIQQSNVNNYGTYRSAYYTVRVPAETYRDFCDRAGELCQVDSFSESVQDISNTYYDTETRLETEKTKLARLKELLAQAEDMEDIITLQSAISDSELTIEELTGTLRNYDSLVGYSTVNLYLNEVAQLSGTEKPAIGFGAQLAAALKTGWTQGIAGLRSFVLGLAANWVGWLIFLIIAAVVVLLIVRGCRRRKRRKAAKAEPDAPSAIPVPPAEDGPQDSGPTPKA